jgi:TIR domain
MADARIFFSYARSDSEFVLKVATTLRAEGRAVWVDQLDIPKGARWDEEVEKALKASGCLLVVMSPASAQSQNVADEVSYALDEKRSVLPILLHPCSIPFRLKRLQYIDFTGSFDVAYRQLAAALDSQKAAAADASVEAPASPAGVDFRPAASPPAAAAPAPTAQPVPPREPPQQPPPTRASLRTAPERPSFQPDPQPARVPTPSACWTSMPIGSTTSTTRVSTRTSSCRTSRPTTAVGRRSATF